MKLGQKAYSPSDVKTAIKAVKEKVECQFALSDDLNLTDIAN